MFELGPLDDLVLPAAHSKTGRALASLSRRRTFEAWKRFDASRAASEASRDAVAALERAFAARLPGDPHSISNALTRPDVGPLVRRALVDDAFVAPALRRWVDAIEGGEPGTGTREPIEGAIHRYRGDDLLDRGLGVDESPVAPDVAVLREALALLRRVSPATREDLDRFAIAMVPARDAITSPFAVGVLAVPPVDDLGAIVHAIVHGTILGKLAAVAEGRDEDERVRIALAELAAEVATGRILRVARETGDLRIEPRERSTPTFPEVPAASAFRSVLDEVRSLAEG